MPNNHAPAARASARQTLAVAEKRPFSPNVQTLAPYLPPDLYQQLLDQPNPPPNLVARCIDQLKQLIDATTSHLPLSLVEWVAEHPTPGVANGRFVQGTLLFADISGFTAMSEKLSRNGREGAEEVTSVVNRYFDVMLDILQQFDGQLIRFGGDALLGLFEEYPAEQAFDFALFDLDFAPFSQQEQDNSPTRAVMAAMQMQAAMGQFADTQTLQGSFPLQMSVGVHYGRFFAAQLGNSISMEYALFGHDVNKTAAIESAAQAGQVVLDRETYQFVDPKLLCTAVSVPDNADYLVVESGYLPQINPVQAPFETQIPAVPDMETVWQLAQLLDAYTPYLPLGLLPRLVVDARATERQGEHRLVASLFANIEGLSDLVDLLGVGNEAAIVDALNHYFLQMSQAVRQFGGVINKIDLYDHGEKLLITFGAPVAHEDDAERAVRAAAAMIAAMPQLAAKIAQMTRLPNLTLTQRIGISYGSVFAGFVGSAWRHEYTVMGDEVNLAARLMGQAAAGATVVSQKVRQRAQLAAEFAPQGVVKLKGKAEPVPIFQLTAVSQASQPRRAAQGMRSPLVGREAETAVLQQKLDALVARNGGITAVIADAGLGKSRLVEASLAQLPKAVETATVRCLSYAETVSYSVMQELVRRLCQIAPEQDAAQALAQLNLFANALWSADEAAAQLPYLINFLNLKLNAAQYAKINYLDGEGLRQRTFIALRALFAAVARRTPIAIVLDDLHWIDGASHDLLAYLLPLANSLPIHWLLLFRPERQKGCWQLHETVQKEQPTYEAIQLAGLSAPDARQLLTNLLAAEQLPTQIVSLVLSRAEGNPLYLEEVVRGLINDKVLRRDENGRWQHQPTALKRSVPDTLEGVLMARLDRLETMCRRAVQVASVIGRTFPFDVLNQTTDQLEPEQLTHHLAELQLSEMIETQQQQPELVYGFIHSLLQEVAYGSQSVRARQQYHQLIAAYLDEGREQGWGDMESVVPLIAHHAYSGGDWPRALQYQIKTGEFSMRLFANQEAIDHYLKALESAEKLPETETAVQRLNIHLSLGQIYITTDQYSEASEHLDQAELLAQQLDDGGAYVAVCRWRTRLHELKGEYDAAFRWIERGLSKELDTADVPQIMLLAGLIHIRQGQYEDALRYCHTVLELAEQQGEVTAVARANNLLGITFLRGDSQQAIAHFQEAFGLYQQAGDVQGEATTHNLIANAYFSLGQWTEADTHYRQALTIFDQISDTYNRIMAVNNLGGISLNQGKLDDALDFYKEGLDLTHKIGGSAWMLGVFEMNLGATHLRLRQPAAALNHLNASEKQFSLAGSRDFLPEMLRHRASAMLLAQNLGEAEQIVDEAFALAQVQENQSEMGSSQRVRGEILLCQDVPERAIVALENSVSLLESVGEAYELAKSRFWLAKAIWLGRQDKACVLALLDQVSDVFDGLAAEMDRTAVLQFQNKVNSEK